MLLYPGGLVHWNAFSARGGATVTILAFDRKRWAFNGYSWLTYLHFRAYDTMSLHVYMHYGWLAGSLVGWLVGRSFASSMQVDRSVHITAQQQQYR